MRFHGCIFSLSTGTPTIGIDYSTVEKGKVYNLFKNIQKENQVVNLNNFKQFFFYWILTRCISIQIIPCRNIKINAKANF